MAEPPAPPIDNGNHSRFCDYVSHVNVSRSPQSCIRGADHNGPHAFTEDDPLLVPIALRWAKAGFEAPPAPLDPPAQRIVQLGVIEFHSESANHGLMERFYAVVKDLRDSGSIVDIWLMDIATVLHEFGYEMTISTTKPLPTPGWLVDQHKARMK